MIVSRRKLLATTPLLVVPSLVARAADLDAKSELGFREVTEKSERAVRKGTEWLMKTMHRDGGCGVDIGQPGDIGCTSMVGLSLMSQGNTQVEGQYSNRMRRLRDYILKQVENMPSDDITSATHTQLQNKIGRHAHSFFATLFMSQMLGEGQDPEVIRPSLKKVVEAVVNAQQSGGNWAGRSWAPTLGTVMGWVALRAADFAGIKVGGAPEKVADYLVRTMTQQLAQVRGSWMHTLYKNAAGIRVLYAMGREKEGISNKAFEDVVKLISKDNTAFTQAGGEEYLAFHLITETMLQKNDQDPRGGSEDWRKWFPTVRDKIISVQNSDGSWAGAHCITSRTFCTACACLVLTAPYRYLPISQP